MIYNAGKVGTNDFNMYGDNVEKIFFVDASTEDIIINDNGDSRTILRIEGDTDANLFATDAVNDRVGIGTNSPSAKLDVEGNIELNNNNVTDTNCIHFNSGGMICSGS